MLARTTGMLDTMGTSPACAFCSESVPINGGSSCSFVASVSTVPLTFHENVVDPTNNDTENPLEYQMLDIQHGVTYVHDDTSDVFARQHTLLGDEVRHQPGRCVVKVEIARSHTW